MQIVYPAECPQSPKTQKIMELSRVFAQEIISA